MCRSAALIHPAALTAEEGREGARQRPLLRSIFREIPENRRTRVRGRIDTFRDGGVRARSAAGAAPRRGPDGGSSPQIKLNEVGVEAHSGGLGVNFVCFFSGVDRVCLFLVVASVRLSDTNSGSAALHTRAETLPLPRCVLLPVPRE